MELLHHLNPAQHEAVTHQDGPLLIIAGAGSGKTRVLTTRIAWLISQRVEPENVLAITFTNKAAREMKSRIQTLVGDNARNIWVSTFHSMGNRILRRHIGRLGYETNFAIYDSDDSARLHKENVKELGMDDKKFTPRAVAAAISRLKNELKTPAQAEAAASGDYYQEQMARLYFLYERKLRQANALDFDDLQLKMVALFRDHPEVLRQYQEKFRYISVDEYQDTNRVQYTLVKMLAARHRNLCVVGDPDQSIYGWRGADMRNILDFEKDYPEARVITLIQNYRSTGHILKAANGVITRNQDRRDKELWTDREDGKQLKLYEGQDENHEAWFIASEIEAGMKKGRRYSDFAVLYRTNAQSRALEKTMKRQAIPYRIYGGVSFYARKEIKDILGYLAVLHNPRDLVNLRRVINVPKRGIGDATVEKVVEYARENELPVYEAVGATDNLASGPRNKLQAFFTMMESLREKVDRVPLTELVGEILENTGYMEALRAERTPESVSRIENLQEFLTETMNFDRHSEDKTLEGFLAETSLYTDMDSGDGSGDAVTLLTIHSAKGLEFPVVFVAGMEEEIFPHQRVQYSESELEEERRLCYVAITRGMEQVYLTRAWQRNMFGMTRCNPPSRFLDEIPKECLLGSFERDKEIQRQEDLERAGTPGSDPGAYLLGDRVVHAKFGEGVIVATEGRGPDTQLSIAFPGQGIKIFMAQFAPIRKVK